MFDSFLPQQPADAVSEQHVYSPAGRLHGHLQLISTSELDLGAETFWSSLMW